MITNLAHALLLGVTITMAPDVKISGTEMTLGEIVTVQGDAPDVARVSAINLGYAPAPGYHRLLQRHRIQQMIRDMDRGIDLVFAGSQTTRVEPLTVRVEARVLEAAARKLIEGAPGAHGAKVHLGSPIDAVEVPVGERPYELRAELPPGGVQPGDQPVPVRVYVDGQVYRTVWTRWTVELWRSLPVLTRAVGVGGKIDPSMIEMRRVQITPDMRGEPLEPERLLGTVAARSLRVGQVVTEGDVVRPDLVREGDVVHLEVRRGPVTARATATVLQRGARGDRVRVSIQSTGREMTAVVFSRELVVIDYRTR